MNAVLDAFRQAQFSMTDFLRQAQGDAVGAFGLDPTEAPYRIVASGTHWCLRDYGGEQASPSLLNHNGSSPGSAGEAAKV